MTQTPLPEDDDAPHSDFLSTLINSSDQIQRAAVVVAHPDDETICLGGLLPRLHEAVFIYTTDGAPRDMADAVRAGFLTRHDYRAARQSELRDVLRLAGITQPNIVTLPFVDQETSQHLTALTFHLARIFNRITPELIFTHAYEGGHPDHDATAFAVHHAVRLTARHPRREAESSVLPRLPRLLIEFAAYHEHDGAIRRLHFLEHNGLLPQSEVIHHLAPASRALKRRMFSRFTSQATVLAGFDVSSERFRLAPRYDFSRPPHAGRLHYETFDWGWTGERWRTLADAASRELSTAELEFD